MNIYCNYMKYISYKIIYLFLGQLRDIYIKKDVEKLIYCLLINQFQWVISNEAS